MKEKNKRKIEEKSFEAFPVTANNSPNKSEGFETTKAISTQKIGHFLITLIS